MTPTRDIDEQTNAAIRGMTERMSVETGEGQEGVAALIAAAPDMMEALVGAKWAMESYICAQLLEKMDEYQNVVKAIQKARGEE